MIKARRNKEKKVKNKQNTSFTLSAFLALGAAIIIYIVLVQFEKNQLSDYERAIILTARTEITKGTLINDKNRGEYFAEKEIEKKMIPADAVIQTDHIEDMVAAYTISEGTYLMGSMFEKVNEIENEYESAKIVSLKADDISQVAGGVLRTGDRVDIYLVNENKVTGTDGEESIEYDAELRWENVYIQQAFDGSGVKIPADNSELSSQRFNIYLDESDIPEFLAAFEKGNLRIVKCCD